MPKLSTLGRVIQTLEAQRAEAMAKVETLDHALRTLRDQSGKDAASKPRPKRERKAKATAAAPDPRD